MLSHLVRIYDGGGVKQESQRRSYEEEIMEWRSHQEAVWRRQPGGGSQEEAARRHQKTPRGVRRHPRGTQEAPRKLPGSISSN